MIKRLNYLEINAKATNGLAALNKHIASIGKKLRAHPGTREVWEHYLDRWTMWNHVRTAAAMVAALLYTLGLMQNGST